MGKLAFIGAEPVDDDKLKTVGQKIFGTNPGFPKLGFAGAEPVDLNKLPALPANLPPQTSNLGFVGAEPVDETKLDPGWS